MLKVVKKTYDEFWGYYWRVTSRHLIEGIFEWDNNLVELIIDKCNLSPGTRILDLGCAGGDQAKIFARKGYNVVGIDKSKSLIKYARRVFADEGLKGDFYVKDMRDIAYSDEFDACVILSGTFGFFSDEENESLLKSIHTALKAEGRAFIDFLSVEDHCNLKLSRTWGPIDGGFELKERWYDTMTSTYRSTIKHIMIDGTIIEPADEIDYHANEVIRCYSIKEIKSLLEKTGFEITHYLTRNHIENPNYVPKPWEACRTLVAKKPEDAN